MQRFWRAGCSAACFLCSCNRCQDGVLSIPIYTRSRRPCRERLPKHERICAAAAGSFFFYSCHKCAVLSMFVEPGNHDLSPPSDHDHFPNNCGARRQAASSGLPSARNAALVTAGQVARCRWIEAAAQLGLLPGADRGRPGRPLQPGRHLLHGLPWGLFACCEFGSACFS